MTIIDFLPSRDKAKKKIKIIYLVFFNALACIYDLCKLTLLFDNWFLCLSSYWQGCINQK